MILYTPYVFFFLSSISYIFTLHSDFSEYYKALDERETPKEITINKEQLKTGFRPVVLECYLFGVCIINATSTSVLYTRVMSQR